MPPFSFVYPSPASSPLNFGCTFPDPGITANSFDHGILYNHNMDMPSTGQALLEPPQAKIRCMEIWGGNEAHDSAISVPGIDAYVYSKPLPGERAGGDIHYVSMCGSGRIARFTIADVSGHGESASFFAHRLRNLMRRNINTLNQVRFARELNNEFAKLSADGTFATAILATYFSPNDHLILVNAGHPMPLWYRADRHEWQYLCPDVPDCASRLSNLPLGVIAPTQYRQFAVPLAKNDLVVIYTDPFTDARSPAGVVLGEQGLLEMVRRLDPADPLRFRESLLASLHEYRGGAPIEDDLTLVLLHHNAAEPPWPGVGETIRNIGKLIGLVDY